MSTFTQSSPGTYQEIRTIHTKGKAIYNRLYYGYGADGSVKTYRGTHEGRLKEETQLVNAETNIDVNIGDIEDNKETLNDHEIRITNMEINKADKCYALAMAIIL